MFTSDQVRLARLALYSYDYANRPDRDRFNRTGIPDGWTQIDERPNDVTGFLSQAFLNASETQLVISFAGTRFEPGKRGRRHFSIHSPRSDARFP